MLRANKTSLEMMVAAYIETALWSSLDDNGDPLDESNDVEGISEAFRKEAENDCRNFIELSGGLIDELDMSMVGHDFWLTRNGHGAGFWDGDYAKAVGEGLTKNSKAFGSVNLYVIDGLVYGQ